MLVIRMQRTGRKGHAMFRVVVQDSRRTPTSGKVVANLGSYDPHNKTAVINKEKAQFYLDNGAQPSERAVLILTKEGIKLPKWVKPASKKERSVRNPEKRRSTAPAEPEEEAPAKEDTAEEPASNEPEASTEAVAEEPVAEATAEKSEPEAAEEKPAEA